MKEKLPNSVAVLVLGIISLCICGAGLVTGIIALVMAKRSLIEYNMDPDKYDASSLSQLKAGKTCAIIGVCLQGAVIVFYILYFLFVISLVTSVTGARAF